MEYVSTRDKSRKVSAAYAIANGIAPDGGLYCPTSFPALTAEDWHALANLDYKGRSALVLGKFLTDFSAEELAEYAAKAEQSESVRRLAAEVNEKLEVAVASDSRLASAYGMLRDGTTVPDNLQTTAAATTAAETAAVETSAQ